MDDIFKKHGFLICSLSSLVLGALIFVYFFGYKIINPFYTNWIYHCHLDLAETYLGWTYFSHSPWSFPLGTYDSLSYPIKTTILNTDSIPLFAIFFKLFKGILPSNFQYWGLYVLLCLMFQSFFGMLIIRKFTKNDLWGNLTAILSGGIFCLMPSMLIKAFWHTTSVYHFLLLMALIPIVYQDKFNLRTNIIYYGVLGFLCGSIQPYILAINAIVLSIFCVYKWSNEKKCSQFLPFVSYCTAALCVLYLIGAFVGTYEFAEIDLFENSFNLNGFFNSHGFMNLFNHVKVINDSQSQGFAYYGLGILIIIAVCLCHLAKRFIKDNLRLDCTKYKKEVIFIIISIVLSVILALSPQITFSDIVLFQIPLPDFIMQIWSTFRCTGRFIWIASYIILILSLIYFINNIDKKKCIIIMICCIALQLWDFQRFSEENSHLKDNLKYNNVFDNERWNDLYKKNTVKNIYWDKKFCDKSDRVGYVADLENLSSWAIGKDIKFNCFYFARKLKDYDKYYYEKLKKPNDEDIFIFLSNEDYLDSMMSETLNYYYLYDGLIISRKIKINGWDDIQIQKSELKNHLDKVEKPSSCTNCTVKQEEY